MYAIAPTVSAATAPSTPAVTPQATADQEEMRSSPLRMACSDSRNRPAGARMTVQRPTTTCHPQTATLQKIALGQHQTHLGVLRDRAALVVGSLAAITGSAFRAMNGAMDEGAKAMMGE